jgi:hypothetical protein
VDQQSGILHGHPYEGLALDHFNLNKFEGPEDPDYISVKNAILNMMTAALESRNSSKTALPREQIIPETRQLEYSAQPRHSPLQSYALNGDHVQQY